MGHYLSACALMYAGAGDTALKAKADAIVAELAKCQDALPSQGYNEGYLPAFPESWFDRVDNQQPVWAPWYTMHKIMAGLLDMYLYCGNTQALDALNKLASWVKFRTDRLSYDQMQASLNNEFGGMGEVLANLYAVTGNPDHLTVSQRFEKKWFVDPLAQGIDNLKGLHSNTHVPQVIAAAREYEFTGEQRYQDIASFFWHQVVEARSYATGGSSNYEYWRTDPYVLASELSDNSQETCCTYNMLKLTKHLLGWYGEAGYGDYYERALLNHILVVQYPGTSLSQFAGMNSYYTSLAGGHWKLFHRPYDDFWCCTGTGMEGPCEIRGKHLLPRFERPIRQPVHCVRAELA